MDPSKMSAAEVMIELGAILAKYQRPATDKVISIEAAKREAADLAFVAGVGMVDWRNRR
jgi:hypothetical protein